MFSAHNESSNAGVKAWLHQRITGAVIIVFIAWVLDVLRGLYSGTATWSKVLYSGMSGVCFATISIAAIYHAVIGMELIFEDYIRCHTIRFWANMCLRLLAAMTALVVLIATAKAGASHL